MGTLSVLQRELTEELQNVIACMTDCEHFPSSEKRKDNFDLVKRRREQLLEQELPGSREQSQ